MKVYFYVVALVSFIFIHTSAHALNNSLATAMDVGSGGTVNDMLTYGDAGTTADDKSVAYYKFTLSSPSFVTINVKPQSPTANGYIWDINLNDDSGTNLLYFDSYSNTASGDTQQIGLPAGTYSIRINSYYNASDVPYQLTVNSVQGWGYEQEPNDSTATATPVNIGTTYTGVLQSKSNTEYDYYKFTLSSPSFITINLKSQNPTANGYIWDINLNNDSGTNLLYFDSYSNTASGDTQQIGLPAGTYSIRINSYYNAYGVPYQLTVNSVQGGVCEQEPNDSTATATPVNIGITYTGVVQSKSNTEYDYYKFTLSSPSNIIINVKPRSVTANGYIWDVYLNNDTGTNLLYFNPYSNAANGKTQQIGLAAGTYYIRVNSYYNAYGVPYQLTVTPEISGNSGRISTFDRIVDGVTSFWADPVDTASGAHVMTRNLLQLNGAQPLVFSISYNSLLRSAGPLGNGFNHNYETNLAAQQDGSIKINWNANRSNIFASTDALNFTSTESAARFDKLTKNTDGTYRLKRKDSSVHLFDANGRLTTISNRFGQNINLTYDVNGRLATVSEPISGKYLTFMYGTGGVISSVGDSAGRSVSFGRDVSNNVTSITDAEGRIVRYTYTAGGLLESGLNNDNSLIFKNTYDAKGRVINQDDGDANTQFTAFEYDETTQPGKPSTTITNREANQRIYVHNVSYQLVTMFDEMNDRTDYEYDQNGNQTSITDANSNKTQMVYDARGNLQEVIDPKLRKTIMTYDDNDNLLTVTNPAQIVEVKNSYYPNNRLWTSTNAMQNETVTYTYTTDGFLSSMKNPNNYVTSFTYTNGLLSRTDAPGGVSTSFEYDQAGRQSRIVEASGKITMLEYDASDNLTKITEPLGHVTSFTYDEHNNRISATDSNSVTTKYYYNGNNKLIRMDQKPDTATTYTTYYEYIGEDRLSKIIDARGNSTTFFYDKKGRPEYTIDAEGNKYTTKYDVVGNITKRLDGYDKVVQQMTYDSKTYKLLSIQDALLNNISYSYADPMIDRVTSILAPDGPKSDISYDNLHRQSGVLANNTAPGNSVSSQEFDKNGNKIASIDPNQNKTNFAFDAADRLVSVATQAGVARNLAFLNGQLKYIVNGKSQSTTYAYYEDGRIKSTIDPVGSIGYTYDHNGNILTITENGRTISYTYDGLGRVTQYTDADSNVIKYKYDAVGNLVELTYPDNKLVKYDYYLNNKLKRVTDWAGRITQYNYDKNGLLINTVRPDGSIEDRTFDPSGSGRLTQLKDTKADGTTIINRYDFTYSAGGNVTEESSINGDIDVSITEADMIYGSDNRLSTFNGLPISYDADGNMVNGPLSGSMQAFSFDSRNRLILAGGTMYAYDANNNRIAVTTKGQTSKYVVNPVAPLSQVLMEKDGSGNIRAFYVYGLGLIGRLDAADNRYGVYHYDRRGSTVALTDVAGNITDTYSYTAYGEKFSHQVMGTASQPFMFNGRDGVMSDVNGLYFMRARYYNPVIKRFINMDTLLGGIEDGQTLNRYAYVTGRPVDSIDPLGRASIGDGIEWIGRQTMALGNDDEPAGNPVSGIAKDWIFGPGAKLGNSIDVLLDAHDLGYGDKNEAIKELPNAAFDLVLTPVAVVGAEVNIIKGGLKGGINMTTTLIEKEGFISNKNAMLIKNTSGNIIDISSILFSSTGQKSYGQALNYLNKSKKIQKLLRWGANAYAEQKLIKGLDIMHTWYDAVKSQYDAYKQYK